MLALGDSDATGIGDPSGRGWVGRYAGLVHSKLGRDVEVEVDNRAAEGETSDQLSEEIAQDQALRDAITDADVVLIGIGGADLNAGDSALDAGQCSGRSCYRAILKHFGENMAAITKTVRRLDPTALVRAMSLPNAYPGAGSAIPPFITADLSRYESITERDTVCRVMQDNGGRCVDVVRAFNGNTANDDAYRAGLMTKDPCCYPSGDGQQLIAQLLINVGVDGLS